MIFLPGKIYYVTYGNWHHDSKPLIFVLHSDANKCHAINIHYLPPPLLLQFFGYIKKFNMRFHPAYGNLGRMVYNIMKQYYPMWVKLSYRTYHSSMLNGFLINDGITFRAPSMVNRPSPEELNRRDNYIKMLNENVKESAILARIPSPPVSTTFAQPKMGQATTTPPPQQGTTSITQLPQIGSATSTITPSFSQPNVSISR